MSWLSFTSSGRLVLLEASMVLQTKSWPLPAAKVERDLNTSEIDPSAVVFITGSLTTK